MRRLFVYYLNHILISLHPCWDSGYRDVLFACLFLLAAGYSFASIRLKIYIGKRLLATKQSQLLSSASKMKSIVAQG